LKPSFLPGAQFGLAGVAYASLQTAQEAKRVGAKLNLQVAARESISQPVHGWALWLVVEAEHVLLLPVGKKAPGAITIDFLQKDRLFRILNAQKERKQPLAKAIGLAKGAPRILDATAGLGMDTQMFLAWGCKVTAMDRSPVLAVLWEKALGQIEKHPQVEAQFTRLHFTAEDASVYLAKGSNAFDVVYLDPMYPERKRSSAGVKKEMQIFRHLVGDDEDAGQMLELALNCAHQRVVVKRPKHAPFLGGRKPSYQVKGTVVRFDVYLA
jgi:16S rRNA (guanine1516-N2)-methyltransferase